MVVSLSLEDLGFNLNFLVTEVYSYHSSHVNVHQNIP